MAWIWIILALLYLLSPYDLIPDFLPLRGWLDDIVVLILILRYVMRIRQAKRPAREQRQQSGDDRRGEANRQADNGGASEKDPYTILGIPPDAKNDEIQSAYRKLASQYHPDKVAHLGAEFQALAEKRFKEIQNAYETVMRR
jgi:uncharacterized membrane protein YkvA (DUF1232 family)